MKKYLIFILVYLIITLTSCKRDFSSLIEDNVKVFPPRNIDTTSHNFKWEIDTLYFPGTYQILPKAIWGADTNDVWMVAHSDDWHARIWHWNGQTWSAYTESGLGTSPTDMIGFAKDDIWFCGNRIGDNPQIKTIQHWDGTSWNIINHSIEEHIMSLWGSSSEDMFFGMIDGRVAHFDGVKFTIFDTWTNAQILDIHGTANSEIFAIGIERDIVQPYDSTSYYIFNFLNNKWYTYNYFLETIETPNVNFPNRDLWSYNNYLIGASGSYIFYLTSPVNWDIVFEPPSKGVWYIGGSGINNIYTAGYLGKSIFHFNGKNWATVKELKNLYFFASGIQAFENHVFICVYANNSAYVIRGRRCSP